MYADVVWKNSFEVLVDLMTREKSTAIMSVFPPLDHKIQSWISISKSRVSFSVIPQIVKNTLLSFSIITLSSFFSNTILYNQVKETAVWKVVQFYVDCIWGSMQEILSIPETLNMFGTIFWLQLEANPKVTDGRLVVLSRLHLNHAHICICHFFSKTKTQTVHLKIMPKVF